MRQLLLEGKKYDPNAIDNILSIYAQIRTNIVEMSWDWAEAEGADEQWKKFVVTEVLREVVSLTHYERLQDKEYMEVSEYVQTMNAPKFYFVIDTPSHSNYSDYQALLDKFNSKIEDAEMTTFLNSNEIIQLSGAELRAVFYQVFFKKSSMSLTHLKTHLDRYKKTLSEFIEGNETEQNSILDVLSDCWKFSYFNQKTIIDILITEKMIDPTFLGNWLVKKLGSIKDLGL